MSTSSPERSLLKSALSLKNVGVIPALNVRPAGKVTAEGLSGPLLLPMQTEVGSIALAPQEAVVASFGIGFTGDEARRVKESVAVKGFKGDLTIPFTYEASDGATYATIVRYKLDHESLTLLERRMK